jgi:transcriptional regulator with XRE-family HTH domain
MTQFHTLLIKNMKIHRRRLHYSQLKLAHHCSVSPNYIGEIEMGRKFPSADVLERIAAALEVKPYQLFVDETDTVTAADELHQYSEQLKESLSFYIAEELNRYVKRPLEPSDKNKESKPRR